MSRDPYTKHSNAGSRKRNVLGALKDGVAFVAQPCAPPVVAVGKACSPAVVRVEHNQRLLDTAAEATAVVPIHHAASTARLVIDQGVKNRGEFPPVDAVITDRVSPVLVFPALQ